MKKAISILFLLLMSIPFFAQEDLSISFWADVMINANHPEHRKIGLDEFNGKFKELLDSGEGFNISFDALPELSVLSDSLNNFKLVTWQFDAGNDRYDYFGYFIHQSGKYFSLVDRFSKLEDLEYLVLNPASWIGGIYYDIHEFDGKYLLFTYRQNNAFEKFKSIEVLSFDEEGTPVLGEELFVFPKESTRDIVQNRVIFNYSSDAVLSLNYNPEMGLIIFDHLMEVIGRLPGQGFTKVPDGTYEGFLYQEGKWIYQEKLFSHTYDEAPRPLPVLEGRSKTIFGKENKKQK